MLASEGTEVAGSGDREKKDRRGAAVSAQRVAVTALGYRPAELTIFQEFFDGQIDIFGYLSEENGGDVSPQMEWNCGAPPIGVAKLLVASFLANLRKTEAHQNVYHFSRL